MSTIRTVDQLVTYLDDKGDVQIDRQSIGGAPRRSVLDQNYTDPGFDTVAEAQALQARLEKFDAEMKALPPASGRYSVLKLQRDSLARAIPHELARYRQIDAERAKTAAMNRTGMNRKAGI